jgi:hypothetical protein
MEDGNNCRIHGREDVAKGLSEQASRKLLCHRCIGDAVHFDARCLHQDKKAKKKSRTQGGNQVISFTLADDLHEKRLLHADGRHPDESLFPAKYSMPLLIAMFELAHPQFKQGAFLHEFLVCFLHSRDGD